MNKSSSIRYHVKERKDGSTEITIKDPSIQGAFVIKYDEEDKKQSGKKQKKDK